MAHTHTDDDDEERFGDLLRSALPPAGPAPPSYQFWAAGQARRSARHHRRVAFTAAAAIVVLMAVSIPVLNRLDVGSSELTTTGTDHESTTSTSTLTSTSTSTSHPGTGGSDGLMQETPTLTAHTTAPPTEATSQDVPERSSAEPSAPVTTTTLVASGPQSRSGNGTTSPLPPPPTAAPSPPTPTHVSLSEAASAAFNAQYGGVTGFEGNFVVHVKPGGIPLPLTFQGYPVVPATYAWSELESAVSSIRAHEQELRATDVPITAYFIDQQTLEVVITVSRLDPTMEQAAFDILGAGPWKLRLEPT